MVKAMTTAYVAAEDLERDNMESLGPIYVDLVKYGHRRFWPFIETGWSQEIEEPYRKGSCLVFRVPFTRPGFAIGIFTEELPEEEALTRAIKSHVHDVPLEDLEDWGSPNSGYEGEWVINAKPSI